MQKAFLKRSADSRIILIHWSHEQRVDVNCSFALYRGQNRFQINLLWQGFGRYLSKKPLLISPLFRSFLNVYSTPLYKRGYQWKTYLNQSGVKALRHFSASSTKSSTQRVRCSTIKSSNFVPIEIVRLTQTFISSLLNCCFTWEI